MQEPGPRRRISVNELPEYTNQYHDKGTQEPGAEGESTVQSGVIVSDSREKEEHKNRDTRRIDSSETPEYTKPLETKERRTGRVGESAVRRSSKYTNPVSTKTQSEHEGESAVQSELQSTKVPGEKDTEPGHEGESAVRGKSSEYTNPVSTKEHKSQGTKESQRSIGVTSTKFQRRKEHKGQGTKESQWFNQVTRYKVSEEKEHKNRDTGRISSPRRRNPEYTNQYRQKGRKSQGVKGQPAVNNFQSILISIDKRNIRART